MTGVAIMKKPKILTLIEQGNLLLESDGNQAETIIWASDIFDVLNNDTEINKILNRIKSSEFVKEDVADVLVHLQQLLDEKLRLEELSKMSMPLPDLDAVAKRLIAEQKKVHLMYAFNTVGKTTLSLKFKELLGTSSGANIDDAEESENRDKQFLYFNAFTEDLFQWDNDIENNEDKRITFNIRSEFAKTIKEQGRENDIAQKFRNLTRSKIDPIWDFETGEIRFYEATSNSDFENNTKIKISRGEERIFIWSIFYILIKVVIEEQREIESSSDLKQVQHIFIDDPISSLDDTYTIDVAVDLANLIKDSDVYEQNENLKFIITTHHSLFYNILFNELKGSGISKTRLSKVVNEANNNVEFYITKQKDDSPFGYHLSLIDEMKRAVNSNNSTEIQKYHFNFMRNLYEKTATFLGYRNWSDCVLTEEKEIFIRYLNLHSHSSHAEYEARGVEQQEKLMLANMFNKFLEDFKFYQKEG